MKNCTPSFTCPVCGRTSWNENDVRERWCNACHGATGYPPPPGMTWRLFRGGSLDGVGRLVGLTPAPETYTLIVTDELYERRGEEFVLATEGAG